MNADERGTELGVMVMEAIADWQTNAPRTQQSTKRILGMSEMGACREYIRATIAGDIKQPGRELKWPAFVGTALGDFIENILGSYGFVTQQDVTVTLPRTGITIRGHLDARTKNAVIDLKTRNGLEAVRRDGPPFKEQAQISGYLVGCVQEGTLDKGSTGHLLYLDRSGSDDSTYVWSVDYEAALAILDKVEDRLMEVQQSIATATHATRDEPESWCYNVQCPFYSQCWEGYTPTTALDHPREMAAVMQFIESRDKRDEYTALAKQDREALRGVEGVMPDGTVVRWTISKYEGGVGDRLDVRVPRT